MVKRYVMLDNHTEIAGEQVILASDYAALEARCAALTRDIETGFMRGAYGRLQNLQAAERRCQELEAALRGLHHECCEAGHNMDKDYKWPIVMKAAASALETGEKS